MLLYLVFCLNYKIVQEAQMLPFDISQNELVCTEIISMLHRIIFSAFYRSQSGNLMSDPENVVKSDIYWVGYILIHYLQKLTKCTYYLFGMI